jgi:hypothetical protein
MNRTRSATPSSYRGVSTLCTTGRRDQSRSLAKGVGANSKVRRLLGNRDGHHRQSVDLGLHSKVKCK